MRKNRIFRCVLSLMLCAAMFTCVCVPSFAVDAQAADCTEGLTPGDANGDGNISLKDVSVMIRKNASWDVTLDKDNADVRHDGTLNLKDVSLLIRYLAGWTDVRLGHLDDAVAEVEPTCTEGGKSVLKCSLCRSEQEVDTRALGHDFKYDKCLRCCEKSEDFDMIHSVGQWVADNDILADAWEDIEDPYYDEEWPDIDDPYYDDEGEDIWYPEDDPYGYYEAEIVNTFGDIPGEEEILSGEGKYATLTYDEFGMLAYEYAEINNGTAYGCSFMVSVDYAFGDDYYEDIMYDENYDITFTTTLVYNEIRMIADENDPANIVEMQLVEVTVEIGEDGTLTVTDGTVYSLSEKVQSVTALEAEEAEAYLPQITACVSEMITELDSAFAKTCTLDSADIGLILK